MDSFYRARGSALGLALLSLVALFTTLLIVPQDGAAQSSSPDAPRLSIGDLTYQGAFRLTLTADDVSTLGWSDGTIGLGPDGTSLFVTGHPRDAAVAEFPIVSSSRQAAIADLPLSGPPLQPFTPLIERVPGGNPQQLERYGGMAVVDGALIANVWEYYDAATDNTQTTLSASNARDLGSSSVSGWGELASAARGAGWISPIPGEWQAALGGDFITGASSGEPISGRWSVGPSAWVVDLDSSLSGLNDAEPLMDFPLATPMAPNFASGGNDLWTSLSDAAYGFIVPGTSTYLAIGDSGGHNSGVSYGTDPNSPDRPKTYYANDATDYSAFYWLFDVNDFVSVRNGDVEPHELRPYDYGPLDIPFLEIDGNTPFRSVGGATFDPATGTLYLSLTDVDRSQSRYDHVPLILSFSLQIPSPAPTATLEPTTTPTPEPTTPEPTPEPTPFGAGGVLDPNPTFCPPYAESSLYRSRTNQLRVGPDEDWEAALVNAPSGTEILLEDGEYLFSRPAVYLEQTNITIRSASGDRDRVILRGQGYSVRGEGLMIAGPNATIAEVTITGMREHGISIKPAVAGTATHVYGVHLYDIGTQFIKGSGGAPNPDGVVACTALGYSPTGAEGDYTGAIDIFTAIDWVIRDNYIYNISGTGSGCEVFNCDTLYVSGPAITLWQNSVGGVIERNTIVDSFRGITLGLGTTHQGGVVRNNFIYNSRSDADAGIELWNANDVLVEHNTVLVNGYPGAIEFGGAPDAIIRNNLLSAPVWDRSASRGASAGAIVVGNIGSGSLGDLGSADGPALTRGSIAIGAGAPSPLSTDFEGDYRLDRSDVGADHRAG